MKHIIYVLFIIFCFSYVSADTGIEFGLNGNSGWSNNKYLEHPNGWGISISKSLSEKVTIRFSFDRYTKDFWYIGVMQFGFPPPNADTTREKITSKARINFYEFSIHHLLVNGSKMRLDFGGGIGGADPKLNLYGQTTGKTKRNFDEGNIMLTFSIDLTIKRFITSPLSLRIGYKYRTVSQFAAATDTFYPFDELTLASININLIARF